MMEGPDVTHAPYPATTPRPRPRPSPDWRKDKQEAFSYFWEQVKFGRLAFEPLRTEMPEKKKIPAISPVDSECNDTISSSSVLTIYREPGLAGCLQHAPSSSCTYVTHNCYTVTFPGLLFYRTPHYSLRVWYLTNSISKRETAICKR